MILTHCGKLGDFVYTWPIAQWVYETTGDKVDFVLPKCFKPFRFVKSLLEIQEFTGTVNFVSFRPLTYGCGGQPYRFNPRDYGYPGDYINLGFRTWPNKYVTEFQAEEHGLKYCSNWKLNLGEPEKPLLVVCATEQPCISAKTGERIDLELDVLYNARRMARSTVRKCYFSGMAAILYLAQVPFYLFKESWQPCTDLYFPDRSRFTLVNVRGGRNPDSPVLKQVLTKGLVLVNGLEHVTNFLSHNVVPGVSNRQTMGDDLPSTNNK